MNSSDKTERKYEAVSPTARSAFWLKSFADIPYVREIYEELESMKLEGTDNKIRDYGINHVGVTLIAPYFEARYKIINKLLKEIRVSQIIELASGLTPRGLELTEDKYLTYVELDLLDMIEAKKKIIENVLTKKEEEKRSNLHLEPGNALEEKDLRKASSYFDDNKKIAIVNEGLLRYLNREEQAKMARVIFAVLNKYSGVWITPDIGIREKTLKGQEKLSPDFKNMNKKLEKSTGAGNFSDNLFTSPEEAKEIYEKLGFSVEIHKYNEVRDQLVSPAKIGQPKDYTDSLMEWSVVFIMRPKNHANGAPLAHNVIQLHK